MEIKFAKREEYEGFIDETVRKATGARFDNAWQFAFFNRYPVCTLNFMRTPFDYFRDIYKERVKEYEEKAPHTQHNRTAEDEISSVLYRGWILEDLVKYCNTAWGVNAITYGAQDKDRDCLSVAMRTHDEDLKAYGNKIEVLFKDSCRLDREDYAVVLSDGKLRKLQNDGAFLIQFGKMKNGRPGAMVTNIKNAKNLRHLPVGYNGSTTGKGYNVCYFSPFDCHLWDLTKERPYEELKKIFRKVGIINVY